jgi:hypothetical protein
MRGFHKPTVMTVVIVVVVLLAIHFVILKSSKAA